LGSDRAQLEAEGIIRQPEDSIRRSASVVAGIQPLDPWPHVGYGRRAALVLVAGVYQIRRRDTPQALLRLP
jgi:hypothetical protein